MSETVSIRKGQKVSLEKGLNSLRIELVWEASNRVGETFDPDVMAVELTEKGARVVDWKHLVFFNSQYLVDGKLTDPEHAVVHSGDDRDGSGDGEEMIVYFKKLNERVGCITFLVNIYQAKNKGQTFRDMKNAVIRAYKDNDSRPCLVYKLDESYGDDTNIVFCSVVKKPNGGWEFQAEGEGSKKTLSQLLNSYGIETEEDDI